MFFITDANVFKLIEEIITQEKLAIVRNVY
jgi:hypothetical protein